MSMRETLAKLIDESSDLKTVREQLEKRQVNVMDRLDNVEDSGRRRELEAELQEIEDDLLSVAALMEKISMGMLRDEGEDFSDLKGPRGGAAQKTLSFQSKQDRFWEAKRLLNTDDYEKGVTAIRELAEEGYPMAQNELGYMYMVPVRVGKNEKEAVKWFQRAADQGDTTAQCNMGRAYRRGCGVEQNYEKAMQWYQKLAERDNIKAQCELGDMYYSGEGVQQNYKKAVECYQKAAESGNCDGQNLLGHMYAEGLGVEQDYAKAAMLFEKAAAQILYEKGHGVPKNLAKAEELYRRAAEYGYEAAKNNLARLRRQTS